MDDDLQLQRELIESEFARLVQVMPERPERERILELAEKGEYGIARHLMLEWLKYNLDDESGLETLSLLESAEGKSNQLGRWGRILLERHPNNPIGLELRLKSSDDNRFSELTHTLALRLLSIQSSNETALSHLTRRAIKFREWKQVLIHSDELLRLDERDTFALLSSARANSALGEREKAADLWERAQTVIEFSDDELIDASRAMYNARRYSGVVQMLQSKCEDIDTSSKIMELLIRAQYSLGLSEECANSSAVLLDSDSDNRVGLRYLSRSLIQLGRLSESIPILEKHCEVEPASADVWESLIETHLRMDQVDSASEAWARLEAKSEESRQLFFAAAEIAQKFHWQEEYDVLIRRKGKLFSDEDGYIEDLARISLGLGDVARAWGLLNEHNLKPMETGLRGDFEAILSSTNTTEEELDGAAEQNRRVWVTELATREAFRRVENRREISSGRPKCHMISSSLDRGGAERQVAITLRHTAESSSFDCALAVHRVEGKAGYGSYFGELGVASERVFILDEIDLMDPNIPGYEIIQENDDLLGLLGTSTKGRVERLISHFAEHQPDLVHAWQDDTIMTTSIAAALTGIPRVVGSARSLRPDEKTELHIRKRPHLGNCFRVIFDHKGHYLNTNSEAGRTSYSEWLGIDSTRIVVIRNGVDFDEMEKRADSGAVRLELSKVGFSEENLVVGGVFRLDAGKRPELWLDAFNLAYEGDHRLRGLIVGGGRMGGAVENWIVEKGLVGIVHLAGESDDVAGWLGEMDVFLFTSMTEGLPNGLIEAQGFGLPVVSTNVGGVSEVVRDGHTGILVSSASAEELSQAVMKLLECPDLEKMRHASILNARNNFSIRAMVQKTEEIYSQALFPSHGGDRSLPYVTLS